MAIMKINIVLLLLEGYMLNNVGGLSLAQPELPYFEFAVDPEPVPLEFAPEPLLFGGPEPLFVQQPESEPLLSAVPEQLFALQPESEPLLFGGPEPLFAQQPESEPLLSGKPEPLLVQQPELAFESQLSNELGLSIAEPESIPVDVELDENLEFATEPHDSLDFEADGSSTSTSTTTPTTSTIPPTTTTTTSAPVVYCDQIQKNSSVKLQLQGRYKVKTDEECRLKCQNTDCMYWNRSRKSCKLLTLGFVQKKRFVSGKCSLSVVKVCEKAGDNTALKLKKIRIVKVSSPKECEEECRNDIENCAAWTCIKNKKCILQNVVFPKKRNQVSGYCTGV